MGLFECHCLLTKQCSINIWTGAPRIEPGAAGCEARTLSIVQCAPPPRNSQIISLALICSGPTNWSKFFFPAKFLISWKQEWFEEVANDQNFLLFNLCQFFSARNFLLRLKLVPLFTHSLSLSTHTHTRHASSSSLSLSPHSFSSQHTHPHPHTHTHNFIPSLFSSFHKEKTFN